MKFQKNNMIPIKKNRVLSMTSVKNVIEYTMDQSSYYNAVQWCDQIGIVIKEMSSLTALTRMKTTFRLNIWKANMLGFVL